MSVPSLESLLDQHELVDEVGYARGCKCGDGYTPLFDQSAHVASVIRQHGLDRVSGLNAAADVVHSEARYQWEKDARRTVCAQIVAQRMDMVERVIRHFADGLADEAEVQQ